MNGLNWLITIVIVVIVVVVDYYLFIGKWIKKELYTHTHTERAEQREWELSHFFFCILFPHVIWWWWWWMIIHWQNKE